MDVHKDNEFNFTSFCICSEQNCDGLAKSFFWVPSSEIWVSQRQAIKSCSPFLPCDENNYFLVLLFVLAFYHKLENVRPYNNAHVFEYTMQ
jgi:hypothetical protein